MKRLLIVICTAGLATACSDSGSAVADYANKIEIEDFAAENLAVENSAASELAEAQPAAPSKNYDFREGELYGYLGAVSEEETKKGVATPSVVMFRYTGYWDGAHHLQWVSDSGAVLQSSECSMPCIAIKVRRANGTLERLGYSRSSIIGGAFEDAINGLLERSPTPGTVANGYRFKGGDPGKPSNWEPLAQRASPGAEQTQTSDNLTAERAVIENLQESDRGD